jgi:hypothetical protein
MAYFVLMGSTDPVTPARTFDLVDDEKLAVEMVRVLETSQPASWLTILPVVAREGMQVRSHAASVERAQQEYDDREEEVQRQATEVRAEALRRLGRVAEDDGQLGPLQDDDAPRAIDLEPGREGRPRGKGFLAHLEPSQEPRPHREGLLARRRSKRQHDRLAEEQVDTELVELAEQAPTPGPAWETAVVDPELPAANAPRSVWGFDHAHKEHREQGEQGDTSAPVDREQPPERPLTRGFLAARRLKRQQDRLTAIQAATEPAQITEETLPTASENVPPVPAPHRAKARSSKKALEKGRQPPDDRVDGDQTLGSAEVGAKAIPRRRRRPEDRSPSGDPPAGDAPTTVDRRETPVEAREHEPAAAAATSDDGPAETTVEPKSRRKRQQSSRAPRARRRPEVQEDQLSVEQEDAPSVDDAQPSEAPSLFSERVAEYTLAHQRESDRDRRSGPDRRSGIDRREAQVKGFEGPSDRRAGAERRSGSNRRRVTA